MDKMKFTRMFSSDKYKGTKDYIDTQKKYEILRTAIYFGISLSLFIAGIIATGDKLNLLTLIAVLGCLPASKSLISVIMFLRFHSCVKEEVDLIEKHTTDILVLYDMIFTTYSKNFFIAHITVQGHTIACYSPDEKLDEAECVQHLTESLQLDGIKNITIKIFRDIKKYTERIDQLHHLEKDDTLSQSIASTFCSISL